MFQRLVTLIVTLFISLVVEIMERKLGNAEKADLAEGAAVAAAVAATQELIDTIQQLPDWVKEPLKNPLILGRLAKMADDAVEQLALKGMDQLQLPFFSAPGGTTSNPA